MPRKPYRPVPTEADRSFEPKPLTNRWILPLPDSDHEAFLNAIIEGLLDRIIRKRPQGEEALYAALAMAQMSFSENMQRYGIVVASRRVRDVLADVSPKAVQKWKAFNPLGLLTAYHQTLQDVLPLTTYGQRRDWLTQEFAESVVDTLAPYTGADLAERILAHRQNKSPSAIHKYLAKASTWLQTQRAEADSPSL